MELTLLVFDLTDTDNNEAQFSDTSCVRGEIDRVSGCVAKPSLVDPARASRTSTSPRGTRSGRGGGVTVYF